MCVFVSVCVCVYLCVSTAFLYVYMSVFEYIDVMSCNTQCGCLNIVN